MMSLPEQGARVATGIIDALKQQPMMLLILLFNMLVLVMVFWAVQDQRKHTSDIMKTMLDQNAKAIDLLARCVVPKNASFVEVPPI